MSCELKDVSHVRKCDMLLFSREQSGSLPGLLPPAQCDVLAEACQKAAEGLNRLAAALFESVEKNQRHFKSRNQNGKDSLAAVCEKKTKQELVNEKHRDIPVEICFLRYCCIISECAQ